MFQKNIQDPDGIPPVHAKIFPARLSEAESLQLSFSFPFSFSYTSFVVRFCVVHDTGFQDL